MKKTVPILFIIFFLILYSSSLAQQNESQNMDVNISTDIRSSIRILSRQPINLEDAKRINESIRINPFTSPYAGKIVAIGRPSSKIRISYLNKQKLKNQNGSNILTFTYTIAGNDQNNQATAEVLDEEIEKFRFNENGRIYLWIGGHVDISKATPANYIGDFSLDIGYF